VDLRKVVLRLSQKPALFAAKAADSLTGISGDVPLFPFTNSEGLLRVTPATPTPTPWSMAP
jgi:hypothetical protein